MSDWGHFALSSPGTPHQWQAESYPAVGRSRRVVSGWRVGVLCLGLLLTTASVGAVWLALRPSTLVQTRIMADTGGPAGRAALADAALWIGSAPGQRASLDAFGETLVIAVSDEDPVTARQRTRSIADTLLNISAVARQDRRLSQAPPGPVPPDPDVSRHAALLADRSRLQAEMDAADGRMSVVSASLTGIARDIAAGARAVADLRPRHETLDKATVALADLQLQRIQLQSRYQDDYPAVVALDGQIRSLRSFLQDEQHRLDAAARTGIEFADPVLGNERDRLRTELSQWTDRRAAAAAELAGVTRALALPVAARPTPHPEPVIADEAPPSPMLVEAATTVTELADLRPIAAPAVGVVGLLLSLAVWFWPSRARRSVRTEMLLQQLEVLLLPPPGTMASLPPGGYTALARDRTAVLSRPHVPALADRGIGLR